MFIAINSNNERTGIENADKNCEYFCPVCGEKLSIKAQDSLSVRPHFAHKRGTECLDDWKHDMSEWHYNWQCQFPEEYREVVVEKDGKKHRADVLINGFVIEFQHSPISGEEIRERNTFYSNCGYQVIWVFYANDKIQNSVDKEWSIDPATFRYTDRYMGQFEWKRARKEFKELTSEDALYFIEYNTNISADPPKRANIMLLLFELHPKNIIFLPTILPVNNEPKYVYILQDYFVKSFLPEHDDNLTAFEIINKAINYRPTLRTQSATNVPNIPVRSRRGFRL